MTSKEKRYRVTTEYKSIYQIVVEATSPEEAEYFAKDIDLANRFISQRNLSLRLFIGSSLHL
jgi:hypothetical protein